MKKKTTLLSAIFLLTLLLLTIHVNAQMKKVICPGTNEPVMVPKKPTKFYEEYTKKTTVNFKATIDILNKIKLADIDAGTKTEVIELRDKLDQYSSRTQDIIKASVIGFCIAPCDKEIRTKHYALLESISKENTEIEKLKLQLKKIAEAGNVAGMDDEKIKSVIKKFDTKNADKIFAKH
jgi:hypothetical protein